MNRSRRTKLDGQTADKGMSNGSLTNTGPLVLVDAHVHIYDCFDLASQLRSSFRNFADYASRIAPGSDWTGCLLLSESRGFNWFDSLNPGQTEHKEHPGAPGWKFKRTSEPQSVEAIGSNEERLYIVDGRQIVVSENLEVLALCTSERIPDGLPMSSVVSRVQAAGGLAVVPWGAGKWWFTRGRFLEGFAREAKDLCLGDNANRPTFMSSPRHFELADEWGVPILPGTDPLPMTGEELRTASFGFAIDGLSVLDRPARAIRDAVLDGESNLQPFGELESMARFFVNQFKINVRKRLPKKNSAA